MDKVGYPQLKFQLFFSYLFKVSKIKPFDFAFRFFFLRLNRNHFNQKLGFLIFLTYLFDSFYFRLLIVIFQYFCPGYIHYSNFGYSKIHF